MLMLLYGGEWGKQNSKQFFPSPPPPPNPHPVCLPSVYVMLLHVTRSPESFLSVYAYCKQSKDRMWDQPGNEAGAGARCIRSGIVGV